MNRNQTIKLGVYGGIDSLPHEHARIVPLGSVRKKLEPEIARIISDHTKSGLNAAIPDHPFSMQGPRTIASHMTPTSVIGVMDVEDAFPSVRIKEKYHQFMYVVWYDTTPGNESDDTLYLYKTTHRDFGVRSLPYLWDRWLGVLIGCGAAFNIAPPTCRYVDDLTFVGQQELSVNASMDDTARLLDAVGHKEKLIKRQPAAPVNEVLGCIYDCPNMRMGVTPDKLRRLRVAVAAALDTRSTHAQPLRSLLGSLAHAASVAPPYMKSQLTGLFNLAAALDRDAARSPRRRRTLQRR